MKMGLSLDEVLQHCKSTQSDLFFKVPEEMTVFAVEAWPPFPQDFLQGNTVRNNSDFSVHARPDIHFLAAPPEAIQDINSESEYHLSSSSHGISSNEKKKITLIDRLEESKSIFVPEQKRGTFQKFILLSSQHLKDASTIKQDNVDKINTLSARIESKDFYITDEAFEKIKSIVKSRKKLKKFTMSRRDGVFTEGLYQMNLTFDSLWTNVQGNKIPSPAKWRNNAKAKLRKYLSDTNAEVMASLICPSDSEFTDAQKNNKPIGEGYPTEAFIALYETALRFWDTNPNAKIIKDDLIEALKEKGLKNNWANCGAVVINVNKRAGRRKTPQSSFSESHMFKHLAK